MHDQPPTERTTPRLSRVLETVLYFSDQERTKVFYGGTLGLRLLDHEPGRSLFYRVGPTVLLLFRAEVTLRGGKLPPHGARGPIHVCFQVPDEDYAQWKGHLERKGVPIVQEVRWGEGASFYFEDPDLNLLEIANRDIWPR